MMKRFINWLDNALPPTPMQLMMENDVLMLQNSIAMLNLLTEIHRTEYERAVHKQRCEGRRDRFTVIEGGRDV